MLVSALPQNYSVSSYIPCRFAWASPGDPKNNTTRMFRARSYHQQESNSHNTIARQQSRPRGERAHTTGSTATHHRFVRHHRRYLQCSQHQSSQ
jgi:hypothetical protein